jgi:uncharacterized protein YyaL (SSP411 family)
VTSVHWLPWSADAFARARTEDKPVLLSIAAVWCESCHDMDRTTYADPGVVALVNDRFVPIRVDADRRPDISERYNLGGWPTTAFLTADGDVIGGGTYVPIGRMSEALGQVADAFRSRRQELAPQRTEPLITIRHRRSAASAESPVEVLTSAVFESFDAECGGFGTEPKFPLIAPLELALALCREGEDSTMAHIVETTLDAMAWGGLYDEVDGGFFRFAVTRAWQEPHHEKLLDVNASLLRLYIEASEALKIARYRERASEVLRYVQTWLADPVDGGWGGSQQADATYYAAPADARRQSKPPHVDPVLYAGWNALMVSAALRAAEVFDDTELGEFALRSLERVVVACYKPGAGVAHCLEGRPSIRGLLDDQVSMIAAHLDAHGATGNIVYEMMAQELAHYAVRTMWDDAEGGFFDRADVDPHERIGLMCERLKPFVANCEAARVLKRLAATPGDHDFGARAAATLAAMAPLASQQGPLAAHYLLALRETPDA